MHVELSGGLVRMIAGAQMIRKTVKWLMQLQMTGLGDGNEDWDVYLHFFNIFSSACNYT